MLIGRPGECLLIETNQKAGYIQAHLFVIILEGEVHTRNTIIVNIQTIRNGKYDGTVVLRKGDHPFIKLDSYVNYRLAKIVSLDDLQSRITQGTASIRPPFTGPIFQQIRDGIIRSPFTPYEVVEMYQNNRFSGLISEKAK